MIIRSISGIRGLTPSYLNVDMVRVYARALHTYLEEGLVFLGRDSRPSGEELLEVFTDELVRLGRDIIVCGVVPTPTVQFMVERSEAAGGVIITASHNPIKWNGIKFLNSLIWSSAGFTLLLELAGLGKHIYSIGWKGHYRWKSIQMLMKMFRDNFGWSMGVDFIWWRNRPNPK